MKTLLVCALFATTSCVGSESNIPHLRRQGEATQLIVDGAPLVLLAGELHNSSSSSLAYMAPIWDKLIALRLNTVLAAVSWELIEPEEGRFDFTLVDGLVKEARRHNLRLVLLWFGSWKNGVSSYTPAWVKRDTQRFPRAIGSSNGNKKDLLTPFSDANCAADTRAFAALMRHIRAIDEKQRTVVMMQVENEVGIRPEPRDLGAAADAAYRTPVPEALMAYLRTHKDELLPEVNARWAATGFKETGTWTEVFGEGVETDEIFMAWHYARYIGKVAQAGKEAYPLPMYVNAWLEGDGKPGDYPSGGPVAKMMDIWRAAAPAIDCFAPDIYLPDFAGICASYTRSGNPLFIPEAARDDQAAARACWAIGEHRAIGFSPFGIESLSTNHPLVQTYAMLGELMPLLTAHESIGVYRQPGDRTEERTIDLAGWRIQIRYESRQKNKIPLGVIINTGFDEFIVAGNWFATHFAATTPGLRNGGILYIEEGRFRQDKWIPGRRLNGDESGANWQARLPPFSGDAYADPDQLRILRVKLYRFD